MPLRHCGEVVISNVSLARRDLVSDQLRTGRTEQATKMGFLVDAMGIRSVTRHIQISHLQLTCQYVVHKFRD